jgi:serine/threonine protein kinase
MPSRYWRTTRPVRNPRSTRGRRHGRPNIVTIHSVEAAAGVQFLTMELVDGKPVSEPIVDGGLPIETILTLAIPLADAISAAHQKGITHRDLKPRT